MLEESNTVRPIVMVLANPGIGKPSILNVAEVDLVPTQAGKVLLPRQDKVIQNHFLCVIKPVVSC